MWKYKFDEEALKDLKKLDKSQQLILFKKLDWVIINPLPYTQGGRGIPLGNKFGINLTGYCEVKHRGLGLRAIYQIIKNEMIIKIIAVDKRDDEMVYKVAYSRIDDK